MVNFLIYPSIDGDHKLPPEVNQAIAESPELIESFAALGTDDKLLDSQLPTHLTPTTLNATYVPKWKANTAYLAGDKVLSPAGDVVSAKVNFTSGATFNAANWDYSSTFAKSDAIPGLVATEVTTQLAVDGTIRSAAVEAVDAYVAAGGIAASGPSVVWEGDSLSAQGGSTATNPAGYLAAYTLQTVRTDAVGGETAEGIAARTNAMPFLMLPAGGSIPASGGVTVTFTTPSGQTAYPLLQTNGNPTLGQTFVGAIKLPQGVYVRGTLTLTQPSGTSTSHQVDDYYTFTRTTAGSSIAVARPAPFYVDFAEAHRGDIHILQYGRNNMVSSGEDVTTAVNRVLAAVAAKVAYLRAAQKRFIIVGVHNGAGEASGTLTYQKVVALNAALKALYGRLFVDYRTYLIAYGLADAAITATGADTTAIAEDRVPPSLLTDGLHLQLVTRQIIAKLVGDREYELGWISLTDTIAPSAPTSLASSSVGATSFTLTWVASTDNLSVAAYDVYLDGVLKTTVTSTSATLTGLTGATAYVAMVKARDDAGNVSAASATLSVTTQTLVADTFDRADSATVGGIWTSNALYKIASNKLTRAASSGTVSVLSSATAMSTPNHKASVVINRGTATTTGLVVRRVDDNNFYAARVNLSTNNVLLYKVVAGVTTSLSGLDNQWLAEGSTLTLEVIGTTLKAYVNGTQVLSTAANEAALVSGTGVGIRADAAGATLPTFDNFSAEAYA
jgi:chitodextrinase